MCLCALDCRLVLIIVVCTSGVQRLAALCGTLDGVHDKLERIRLGTRAPIAFSLLLVVGDHVIMRLIARRF